jgi:uncharacterized C2H2 Zn-finger protein
MNTRTGEKPHSCPHCTKSFSVLKNLLHHLKTHTEEKGHYGCDQCDKLFAHPDDLMRHSKIYSSTKLTATEKAFNKVESEFYIEKKEEIIIFLWIPRIILMSLFAGTVWTCVLTLFH